ncbi:MAG: amidohydrolase family protein [Elusimicrobia bacterium]|nr:amidohydrolase family protein [Elusimicrobiota bacterium]
MKTFDSLLRWAGALVLTLSCSAAAPPDWAARKQVWRQSLSEVRAAGRLPIIDLESSYFEAYMNPEAILSYLRGRGFAVVAWSVEDEPSRINGRGYGWWVEHWQGVLRDLEGRFPGFVLPVPSPTGVISNPPLKIGSQRVLDDMLAIAEAGSYPMLGEFFFRRYPSPRNMLTGGDWDSDLAEPIDGPIGRRLFAFSQRTAIPFQIHYETEDALIPPLEAMLRRYPRARVIWCHGGRVRRPEKAPHFTAHWSETLRRLLEEHPNLYFDVSSIDPDQAYPAGGPSSSLWWDMPGRRMKREGVKLVSDHPWRFLAALDQGVDRAGETPKLADRLMSFLESLPPRTREVVAYRAAWKLLFGEDLSASAP